MRSTSGETCFSSRVSHDGTQLSLANAASPSPHTLPGSRGSVEKSTRHHWAMSVDRCVASQCHTWLESFPCSIRKVHEEAVNRISPEVKLFIFPVQTSVNVLGEPAETLAVALPLEHTAHEHFHGAGVQLLQSHVPLREANPERPVRTSHAKAQRHTDSHCKCRDCVQISSPHRQS